MKGDRDDDQFADEPLPPEDGGKAKRPARRARDDDDDDDDRGRRKSQPKKGNNTLMILGIVGGVLFVVCLGCGGVAYVAYLRVQDAAERVRQRLDYNILGMTYLNFVDIHKRGPAGVDELQNFDRDPGSGKLYEAIRAGKVTVIWNVTPFMQKQGANSVVLAHEAQPHSDGKRLVLMADGSVRDVPEAEFQNLPKAQPGFQLK